MVNYMRFRIHIFVWKMTMISTQLKWNVQVHDMEFSILWLTRDEVPATLFITIIGFVTPDERKMVHGFMLHARQRKKKSKIILCISGAYCWDLMVFCLNVCHLKSRVCYFPLKVSSIFIVNIVKLLQMQLRSDSPNMAECQWFWRTNKELKYGGDSNDNDDSHRVCLQSTPANSAKFF